MEETQRQLNMEEKKNLQRLLFSDITTASSKYQSTRAKEREAFCKSGLIEKAPPALLALASKWKNARDTQNRVEKQLKAKGYAMEAYPAGTLKLYYSKPPKALPAFDEETRRTERKSLDLKRDFTLRLFTGGEEARGLFSALSGELTKIQKD
jgi:hypothetical protein